MSKVTILSRPNRIVIASKGVQGAAGPEGPEGEQGERGPMGDVTPEALAARDAAQGAASAAAGSAVAAALSAAARLSVSNPSFGGGAVGDGLTDDTAALTAALAAAAGRILHFDKPGATYLTGALIIPSNTTLVFEPGITLKKKLNGARVLYLLNCENVIIHGNGVTLDGSDLPGTTAFSHTLLCYGAKRCLIENVNINGAGAGGGGKDCVYIGDGGQGRCEDVAFRGGRWLNSKRNGVSFVAGKRCVVDGVEIAYATGAPGAGVDFEANFFGECEDNTIRNCHIHHNENGGIVSIFGTGTVCENNEIHHNGTYGIGISSGGAEFEENVYRPNLDVVGISAFDMATGAITVGANLSDMPVGTTVNMTVRNGATRPPEFASGYYVVSRHVGSNAIILGTSVGRGEITSLSGVGTGTLSADPALSHVRLISWVPGQSDGYYIARNRIYNNGAQGVFMVGSGYHKVVDNVIWDNTNGIQAQYTRDIQIVGNRVFATAANTSSLAGINCSRGGGALIIERNAIDSPRFKGISVNDWTGAVIEKNRVWDAARSDPSSSKAGIYLSDISNASVVGNTVRQAEGNTTTIFGIQSTSTVTGTLFSRNDVTQAGATVANALLVQGPNNRIENNIGRNGSAHMEAAVTYDPPSLADGAGVTTTVSVPGAALGDFAEASFSANLNGVTLTAYAFNNSIGVRFQNETGAVVDLASGTLRVRARR